MARAIDAVQVLNDINWHHKPTPVSEFESGFNRGLNQALWIITHAPTLTPPNEALTLAQLREMDGEPVYIVFSPDISGEKPQFWVLVSVDEWNDIYLANKDGWAFNYEEFLEDVEAIYRRPPERQEDTHDGD